MKLFKIGLLSTFIILFTACGNYVEEYTFKSDGSGIYNVYSDVIAGNAEMSLAMALEFSDEELTKGQIDSLKIALTEKIWEQYPGKTDSVVDLLSELPDSFLDYKPCGNYEVFFESEEATFERCIDNMNLLNERIADTIWHRNTFQLKDSEIPTFGFKKVKHLLKNRLEGQLNTGKMMKHLLRIARQMGIGIWNGINVKKIEDIGFGL